MGEVGSIWIKIGAKIDALEKGMSDAEKALKKVGGKFKEVGQSVSIAGAAIVGSMGLAIQKTASFGDELDEMSERTGVSVSVLSSLKLAADKSGTSLGGLAQGMKFLSMSMVETAKATDKSKTELGALGINVKDAAGNMRPLNDVMLDVAERFKNMPDGAQKTALAVKIFGRAGTELIPILNMGRDGLQSEMDMAQKLGIVLSEDAAKACAKFKDAQVDLKAATQGLGMQISTQLIPTLTSLIGGITGIVSGVTSWAKAHPGLSQAISTTVLAIGGVLTASGSFLMVVGTLAQKLVFLASSIGTTAAKLSLSIGIFSAAALAVGYYAVKLEELKQAEDYVIEADKRLQQTENQLIDKLSKAATAAGWQYGAMAKLITAYDGNVVALTQAIRTGKHGVEIQEALVKVGKEHAATVEEEKKKLLEADPVMAAINKLLGDAKDKTKAWNGALGATTKIDLANRIALITTALTTYKDALPIAEQKKLSQELINSIATLRNIDPVTATASSRWDAFANSVAFAAEKIRANQRAMLDSIPSIDRVGMSLIKLGDTAVDYFAAKFGVSANTIIQYCLEIQATILSILNPAFASVPAIIGQIAPATQAMATQTKGYLQEVSTVVSDAMRNIAQALVDSLGIFNKAAKTFDDSYFKKAKVDVENDYQNRKKWIEQNITDEGKRAQALAALEIWRQQELDRIQTDADKKKDEFAKKEEERQNSLWTKVKDIFGKVVEQMLVIWLTKFISSVMDSIFNVGKGLTEGVGGAMKKVGETVSTVATSIGTIITTLATSVATAITTLATGIGTALVTLATAIASAATILAAAAGAIITVGVLAVALYAAFKVVAGVIDKLFGGGSDNGDITYWLKSISENMQNLWNTMSWLGPNLQAALGDNIPAQLSAIHATFSDQLRNIWKNAFDTRKEANKFYGSALNYLKQAVDALNGLPHAQSGAIVSKPSLVNVAERGPEVIVPLGHLANVTPQQIKVEIQPIVIPRGDSYIIEFLQKKIEHGNIRIPITAVG